MVGVLINLCAQRAMMLLRVTRRPARRFCCPPWWSRVRMAAKPQLSWRDCSYCREIATQMIWHGHMVSRADDRPAIELSISQLVGDVDNSILAESENITFADRTFSRNGNSGVSVSSYDYLLAWLRNIDFLDRPHNRIKARRKLLEPDLESPLTFAVSHFLLRVQYFPIPAQIGNCSPLLLRWQ